MFGVGVLDQKYVNVDFEVIHVGVLDQKYVNVKFA